MVLRADFRRSETVSLGSPSSANQSAANYLSCRRRERFFDRFCTLVLGGVSLIACALTIVGIVVGGPPIGWAVTLTGFFLLCLYYGLRQLAGWRWMRRQRAPNGGD